MIVLIVLFLVAKPHVADQFVQSFQRHSTVGHVQFTFRDSLCGCCVHFCGKPAQLSLFTVVLVSSKG